MYKGNHVRSNDLKFNPTELKKKPEEEKDKHDTNNKDYDTIRKLVTATTTRTKNNKYLKYNISMVDVIANSLEDTLIDSLFVQARQDRSVHHQPEELYISSARLKYLHASDWNEAH